MMERNDFTGCICYTGIIKFTRDWMQYPYETRVNFFPIENWKNFLKTGLINIIIMKLI